MPEFTSQATDINKKTQKEQIRIVTKSPYSVEQIEDPSPAVQAAAMDSLEKMFDGKRMRVPGNISIPQVMHYKAMRDNRPDVAERIKRDFPEDFVPGRKSRMPHTAEKSFQSQVHTDLGMVQKLKNKDVVPVSVKSSSEKITGMDVDKQIRLVSADWRAIEKIESPHVSVQAAAYKSAFREFKAKNPNKGAGIREEFFNSLPKNINVDRVMIHEASKISDDRARETIINGALSRNGMLLSEVKDPSREMIKTAVKQNGAAIMRVKNPDLEIQSIAFGQLSSTGNTALMPKNIDVEKVFQYRAGLLQKNGSPREAIKESRDFAKNGIKDLVERFANRTPGNASPGGNRDNVPGYDR